MVRISHFTIVTLMTLCVVACSKKAVRNAPTTANPLIAQAQQYFRDSLSSVPGSKAPNNLRLNTKRTLIWDSAYTVQAASATVVVVPLRFSKDLFMQAVFSGPVSFKLDNINKLVFYKDSLSRFQCMSVTTFPDSSYIADNKGQFTGAMLVEPWDGSSTTKYRFYGDGTTSVTTSAGPVTTRSLSQATLTSGKQVDVVLSLCSEIYGQNYSADDPDNAYSWSEYGACTNIYIADNPVLHSLVRPNVGGGGGGGIRVPIALAVIVASGARPIPDIAQYFGCFTFGDGPSRSYSVEVCVDQPDPGTRQPWTFSNAATGGSVFGNNPIDVGHTFLVLTENDNGTIITRNIGFYPATFCSPTPPRYATVQGMLNNDEDHGYNVSLTINNLSSTQFQAILNSVSLGNNPGYSYDINQYNCTTFAISALANGGINLAATKGVWPNGGGDDPGDLGQDIQGMSLSPNMTRNTVSNPHPNTGNCQ